MPTPELDPGGLRHGQGPWICLASQTSCLLKCWFYYKVLKITTTAWNQPHLPSLPVSSGSSGASTQNLWTLQSSQEQGRAI